MIFKRKYQHYRIDLIQRNIEIQLETTYEHYDAQCMAKELKKINDKIGEHGIEKSENIVRLFNMHGYKADDPKEIIKIFEKQEKIEIVRFRILGKANKTQVNLIMNLIFIEYPNEILNCISNYINNHPTPKLDSDKLMSDLKKSIDELQKQKKKENEYLPIDDLNLIKTESDFDIEFDFENDPFLDPNLDFDFTFEKDSFLDSDTNSNST